MFAYVVYLDISVRNKFEGQKWALPAHVYTRPMEIYIGQRIDSLKVLEELSELGYQRNDDVSRVGTFNFDSNKLEINQREFRFWDGLRQEQKVTFALSSNRVKSITIKNTNGEISETEIVRLEPRLFGSVSPLSHEDRSLLKLEDVPQNLINALISVEDRQFYSHFGVNPLGIIRAMIRNIRAGRVVQGGSTLTQQLVKNYYLTSEQTYKRKITELIMSVLLEIHYSKDDILQAYLNEVYLSQAGNRAIHGFSLASRYFFAQPLKELELHQLAVLAGINNGPSYYNPIRHPQRALERRNMVLKTMLDQNHISIEEYDQAVTAKMVISGNAERSAPLSYPSFMGFIREKLKDDYQQQDLLSDGLQIHTTLKSKNTERLRKNS